MNSNTLEIAQIAKVSNEEALAIQNMIDNNCLVDWSEDSTAKVRKAVKLAQALILVDGNWELLGA